MIEETTIPEVPALIVPPGYNPQPRRWRAIWTRGYSRDLLVCAGAMLPIEARGEGESPEDAIDALLRPLCVSGELGTGDELVVQILELGDDDEVPTFWTVRIDLDAGEWNWSILERDL